MIVDEDRIAEMASAWIKSGMTLKSFAQISGVDIRELTRLISQPPEKKPKRVATCCAPPPPREQDETDWELAEWEDRRQAGETRRLERKSADELFHTNVAREVVLKKRSVESVAREYGLPRASVAKWAEERRERLLAEDRARRDRCILTRLREESDISDDPPKKTARRLWTEEDKREHVRRWSESGVSVNRYATECGVDPKTMYKWVSTYGEEMRDGEDTAQRERA